jgi:hypothetical protein
MLLSSIITVSLFSIHFSILSQYICVHRVVSLSFPLNYLSWVTLDASFVVSLSYFLLSQGSVVLVEFRFLLT